MNSRCTAALYLTWLQGRSAPWVWVKMAKLAGVVWKVPSRGVSAAGTSWRILQGLLHSASLYRRVLLRPKAREPAPMMGVVAAGRPSGLPGVVGRGAPATPTRCCTLPVLALRTRTVFRPAS